MGKIKRFIKGFLFGLYNSVITHVPSFTLRHFYLKALLRIKLGEKSSIGIGCFFSDKNIIIGDNCVINRNCYIDGRKPVIIGKKVSISPECYIVSLSHDKDDPNFKTIGNEVVINDYVWLGVRTLVLPNVVIEEGTVIAAGSVVSKDTVKYSVFGGVPAKKIGDRSSDLQYTPRYFPHFYSDFQ